jgi:hypothetical protein
VDLFLTVHGSGFVFWFQELPPDLTRRLRLVYSTGCGDFWQAQAWLRMGADAFVGHPGQMSASPVFYVYFLRRWVRGHPLDQAVGEANEKAGARLMLAGAWSGGELDGAQLAKETEAVAAGHAALTIGSRR